MGPPSTPSPGCHCCLQGSLGPRAVAAPQHLLPRGRGSRGLGAGARRWGRVDKPSPGEAGDVGLLTYQPVPRLRRDPLEAGGGGAPIRAQLFPRLTSRGLQPPSRPGVCPPLPPPPPEASRSQAFLAPASSLTSGPHSPGCSGFLAPWRLEPPAGQHKGWSRSRRSPLQEERKKSLLPTGNQARATRALRTRTRVLGPSHDPGPLSSTGSSWAPSPSPSPLPPGVHGDL